MVDIPIVNDLLVKIVAAIIAFLAGIIIANVLSKLLKKILKELEINKILKQKFKINLPAENTIAGIIKYLIYFIALIFALNQLEITTRIFYVVLIGILVLIISIILLTIKDFIPNIISGFVIHKKTKIKIGDDIKIKNIEGRVVEITLLETKIQNKNKEIIHVPNSIITKEKLTKKWKKN